MHVRSNLCNWLAMSVLLLVLVSNVSGQIVTDSTEDFETGDFGKFPWEYSGDEYWAVTSSEKHSGAYSAQAGVIGNDKSTTLQVMLDCVSGDISFYRKVSSESGFDYLKFHIDGVEQDEWSGEEDWAEVSFPVTEGTRTFKWTYVKDGSVAEGDDTSWIDDIVFPVDSNTEPPPPIDEPNIVWDRAAYWDEQYPVKSPFSWAKGTGEITASVLEAAGYTILDAGQAKQWMESHISRRQKRPSVIVFCRYVVPDILVEPLSTDCTLRRYLEDGGKVVWYGLPPLFSIGHPDGTADWRVPSAAVSVLGFDTVAREWPPLTQTEITFTADGVQWGLSEPWFSRYSADPEDVRVLALDADGFAAAWVRHYGESDTYRGLVMTHSLPYSNPNFNDLIRVAEYPNVPQPVITYECEDNHDANLCLPGAVTDEREILDDIVCTLFTGWWANPNYGEHNHWGHWDNSGHQPPSTWRSRYLPDYPAPGSPWNPSNALYDSSDTEVLRWQDKAMARAGIDIAAFNWLKGGIDHWTAKNFEKAIRTCKSVQWCIHYAHEITGYEDESDPSSKQIYDDISSVIDKYGPTGNYAKIDGKWLVMIHSQIDDRSQTSHLEDRWCRAKHMLAKNGYDVYLNADVFDETAINRLTCASPWDAIHQNFASKLFDPGLHMYTRETIPQIHDSVTISPVVKPDSTYERSLSGFTRAIDHAVERKYDFRFLVVRNWNEYSVRDLIEPAQLIERDPDGYKPTGIDYAYDYVDALGAFKDEFRWTSATHRAIPPVHLEAEDLIWEAEIRSANSTENGGRGCVFTDEGPRIGRQLLLGESASLAIGIRAKVLGLPGRSPKWPELLVYIDHEVAGRIKIDSSTLKDCLTTIYVSEGVHTFELAKDMAGHVVVESVDIDLIIDDTPP